MFPDEEIVVSLIRQLSWTHMPALIPIDDPIKRDFYIEMCKIEKWSVRTLRKAFDLIHGSCEDALHVLQSVLSPRLIVCTVSISLLQPPPEGAE